MTPPDLPTVQRARLERLLAAQLQWGTWLASVVTVLGMLLARWEGAPGAAGGLSLRSVDVMTAGIALFLLLPVFRLISMLVVFLRQRDRPFVALTALVLTIIGLGVALGLHWPG
ncbi:MAG TPA: DUF1634 domain-containing protein [Chthoniobacteraceae bacterium]|nr:DUF1634 domain-containing protein [Chthoniobacteraceae bacterium]